VNTNKTLHNVDWMLLASVIGLAGVGLYVLNISGQALPGMWQHQSGFVITGMLGFVLISFVPLRTIERMSLPLYGVAVLLLVLLFFFGREHYGAIRWFEIASIRVPPAELMKWVLMFALAWWYIHRDMASVSVKVVPILLIPMVLLFLQPDLGALFQFTMIALMITAAARQWRYLGLLVSVSSLAVLFLWFVAMHEYLKNRVLSYIGSNVDSEAGFSLLQSTDTGWVVIAVGSLMFLFALALMYRMFIITRSAGSDFAFTISTGISVVVSLFIVLNIAILSGLMHAYMPLRPLISYHGMALVFMMMAMGVVMRVAIESRQRAA